MTEDFIRRSLEDLPTIFDHLIKLFKIFLKLKIKTETKRSSIDLKKILNEDLTKISKRFELNIFQRFNISKKYSIFEIALRSFEEN